VEFGILAAQHGLWREAAFRVERAIELDCTYAAAFTNLAVAYGQIGRLDEAQRAYETARALDPDNSFIDSNYETFLDIADGVVRVAAKRPIPETGKRRSRSPRGHTPSAAVAMAGRGLIPRRRLSVVLTRVLRHGGRPSGIHGAAAPANDGTYAAHRSGL
jgi:tetratricopeptide (TPR) repeat protein